MSCPVCRTKQLVEIRMNVGESRVTLHSCSSCDKRWWDKNGEKVGVSGVLDLARK